MILLLGISPADILIFVHKELCKRFFTPALLVAWRKTDCTSLCMMWVFTYFKRQCKVWWGRGERDLYCLEIQNVLNRPTKGNTKGPQTRFIPEPYNKMLCSDGWHSCIGERSLSRAPSDPLITKTPRWGSAVDLNATSQQAVFQKDSNLFLAKTYHI